jgi:hypothetical protein
MAIEEKRTLTDEEILTTSVRQSARPSVHRGTVGATQDADQTDADGTDTGDATDTTDRGDRGDSIDHGDSTDSTDRGDSA